MVCRRVVITVMTYRIERCKMVLITGIFNDLPGFWKAGSSIRIEEASISKRQLGQRSFAWRLA